MHKQAIGFLQNPDINIDKSQHNKHLSNGIKPSIVEVYFPSRDTSYPYFNDIFDLKVGDAVYVEGKLEGCIGRVIKVSHHFKIRISDYKRVISLVDTKLSGELFLSASHFISFDKNTIPYKKIVSWFTAPSDDYMYFSDEGDECFPLDDLSQMYIYGETGEKGYEYFRENRVVYLSVDNGKGKAIVKGRKYYELDFDYKDRHIINLCCPCYCTCYCKHEVAAMLQLRETLSFIEKNYADSYNSYFAAISKDEFLNTVMNNHNCGKISFEIS